MRSLLLLSLLSTGVLAQYKEQPPEYRQYELPKKPDADPNEFKIVRPDISTWNGYRDFVFRLTTVNMYDLINRAAANGSKGAKVIKKASDVAQNIQTEVKVDESTKMDFRFNPTALNAESRVYFKDIALKTYIDPYSIVPGVYYGPVYFKREMFSKYNMLGYGITF